MISDPEADLGPVGDLAAALRESKRKRAEIERMFGFLPMSILHMGRGDLSRRIFNYQQEERGRSAHFKSIAFTDNLSPEYRAKQKARLALGTVSGGTSTVKIGNSKLAVSQMAPELVAFFARYYSKPGDLYIDPFMGHGVRLQVAKILGMGYMGYDVCEEYVRYIGAIRERIDDGRTPLSAILGDSRRPTEIPDNCGDFCFTSPPYWDVEYYGPEADQLGAGSTYEQFIARMGEVARAWLPKFKKDAYVCVNVGDIRRDHKFYPYHADILVAFREAGYRPHDTWIVEGLIGGTAKIWAGQFFGRKVAPRVHEYVLVFRT